ncbi:MAG: Transglutaminase family protein [Microgenomates group bacterium GW2011_GWC1_41_20]|nr:MAG: Transglutaminase family protein [Microgenomates group bacterium GW2011_GWC1_41_20]
MKFKSILISLTFLISYFLIPSVAYAENEFSVDTTVIYNVQESGKTNVTHQVTLENNFSNLYATTYTLSLENIDATSAKASSNNGTIYPVEIFKEEGRTDIKVSFPDTSVGKGAQRHFNITYENSTFAVRTGEVWEISVPRLGTETNFRNYQLILKIPKAYGFEAYISPQPGTRELTDEGYSYTFSKESVTQNGISAGFGQFQVFAFNLSYHLENPLAKASSTQISIPPDTAFQKVYIENIEPKPANVSVDTDGNWIATFDLSARQRIDVLVSGSVQIFASYRSFPKVTQESLNENLKEDTYWQVNDPKIKELAARLKTPEAIYNYVSQTLSYDTARVQPNVQRMGAVAALASPTNAICMEYTDLFIAIARAAGIPAREVNGYAYTENPDLQPLGLVADVLHAWPEYYDREKGVWIAIDPTWGSTTGGIDFFNKLDLRHFAFVLHGASSREPYPPGSYKLGPNPQKDVYVSFGQLPENKISTPTVSIKPFRVLPFFSSIYTVTVSNPGPAALYSVYPTIYYDSTEKTRDHIAMLLPYSNNQIQITLPYSFLGKDMPSVIKVVLGSSKAEILTNKKQIVINSLIIVLLVLIIVMAFIFIKAKKIKIFGFFGKIMGTKKVNNEIPSGEPPKDQIKP